MKENKQTWQHIPEAELPWQYKYPHSAVANDCVIFTYQDSELKVLLIRRGEGPHTGTWALPGGFLKNTETAPQGALRELHEETGLGIMLSSDLKLFGVYSDPKRDPRERVISIAWYAFTRPSEVQGGSDADKAAWFKLDELPPLAFDHRKILEDARKQLKRDIYFEPIGFELLDEEFTLPDLRRLYEKILGRKFDPRNFQRKMLASNILEDTGLKEGWECSHNTAYARNITYDSKIIGSKIGRAAPLYRLNKAKYQQFKDEENLEF